MKDESVYLTGLYFCVFQNTLLYFKDKRNPFQAQETKYKAEVEQSENVC